jgi:hypothetical protein
MEDERDGTDAEHGEREEEEHEVVVSPEKEMKKSGENPQGEYRPEKGKDNFME